MIVGAPQAWLASNGNVTPMRRPNRNIEIFSMSVLDLFAAALGAFILISVILFPNYLKQQSVAMQLEQSQSTVNQCQVAVKAKEETLSVCEAARDSTFIIVVIEWSAAGNYDVDLHVTDPQGNEFYWAKNNRDSSWYPDTQAQLSYDNTRGPGVELWQHPKAEPGKYKVAYNYYNAPNVTADTIATIDVKGNVFYRNGRFELPLTKLTFNRAKQVIANITVTSTGVIDVEVEK